MGFDKMRVTGVFCASATGRKLKPLLMVKQSELSIRDEGLVSVCGAPKSWMNSTIFIRYLEHTFGLTNPGEILLVFDAARSHISREVKAYLQRKGFLYAVIPGGTTAFAQPADVSWFKPLKDKMAKNIDEWKSGGVFEYTRGGRPRPPAHGVVAKRLVRSWKEVSSDMIVKSFVKCFLGSNDDLLLSKHPTMGQDFRIQLWSQ
ncbi:hypothetical protein LEN26_016382 [Aphanomyces euteiches]|nr:hypothetical protein LEN26_016382 [Aphanomyces euteiches]KAH9181719.1 hypothetical protein AeNC1_016305 [Aphanomyces euteiches]